MGSIEGWSYGPVDDIIFAFSAGGHIPFKPYITKFNKLKPFTGNIYRNGTVELSYIIKSVPVAVTGNNIITFNKADPYAGAGVFNNIGTDFSIGSNGKAVISYGAATNFLEFLGLELVIAKGTLIAHVKNKGADFEVSFAGEAQSPPVTPKEVIKNVIGKETDFFEKFIPSSYNFFVYGRFTDDKDDWMLGYSLDQSINFLTHGTKAVGQYSEFEISNNLIHYKSNTRIPLYPEFEIDGTIGFDGSFALSGAVIATSVFGQGPLKLTMQLTSLIGIEYKDLVLLLKNTGKIRGEACADMAFWEGCTNFELGYEATIKTDGSFEICFQIGIDGFGFDVCSGYSLDLNGKTIQTQTLNEIPIESVIESNRFYSEKYKLAFPEKFIDKH